MRGFWSICYLIFTIFLGHSNLEAQEEKNLPRFEFSLEANTLCSQPMQLNVEQLRGREIVIGIAGEILGDGEIVFNSTESENREDQRIKIKYDSPLKELKRFDLNGKIYGLFGVYGKVLHYNESSTILGVEIDTTNIDQGDNPYGNGETSGAPEDFSSPYTSDIPAGALILPTQDIQIVTNQNMTILAPLLHAGFNLAPISSDNLGLNILADLFGGPGLLFMAGSTSKKGGESEGTFKFDQTSLGLVLGGNITLNMRRGRFELELAGKVTSFMTSPCCSYQNNESGHITSLTTAQLGCALSLNLNDEVKVQASTQYSLDDRIREPPNIDSGARRDGKIGLSISIQPAVSSKRATAH